MNSSSSTAILSETEQEHLLDKLKVFKIQGRDKRGRKILLVIGKIFPARHVSCEVLKKYLEEKFFPALKEEPFSVVYLHTGIQRSENFPGISALRSIYDAIPVDVKDRLAAVYFVHPSLLARLFLATFGRLFFSGGFYGKLKYVNRLEFLRDYVRRNEIIIPEFAYDHDEEMECRSMMDYGLESDHPRVYCAPSVESAISTYSTRRIG